MYVPLYIMTIFCIVMTAFVLINIYILILYKVMFRKRDTEHNIIVKTIQENQLEIFKEIKTMLEKNETFYNKKFRRE